MSIRKTPSWLYKWRWWDYLLGYAIVVQFACSAFARFNGSTDYTWTLRCGQSRSDCYICGGYWNVADTDIATADSSGSTCRQSSLHVEVYSSHVISLSLLQLARPTLLMRVHQPLVVLLTQVLQLRMHLSFKQFTQYAVNIPLCRVNCFNANMVQTSEDWHQALLQRATGISS